MTRSIRWLVPAAFTTLLAGCPKDEDAPKDDTDPSAETDPVGDSDPVGDTDPNIDTEPPVDEPDDTDETDDTDDTDVDPSCVPWWPGADVDGDGESDLNVRYRVVVGGGGRDLVQPPVTVDLDLSDRPDLDPATVRAVLPGCTPDEFVELPAQWVDRLVALERRAEHVSPAGDGVGLVAFLYDADGDYGTPDVLAVGVEVEVHLYFGESGTEPAAPAATDLVVTATSLASGGSVATVDPAKGGLLSSLTLDDSPTLTSQAASCCGNSMFFQGPPTGWLPPSAAAATVEVLADGPILGALYATGVREVETSPGVFSGYAYQVLYWKWAGRPEVFHATHQVTTSEVHVDHPNGQWRAFRPWQATHPDLKQGGTLDHVNDPAGRWGAVEGPNWGYALGLFVPPANLDVFANPLVSFANVPNPDFLVIFGNDLADPDLPSPATLPAGTVYADHQAFVVRPFEAPFDDVEASAVEDLLDPAVAVVAGTDERP